MIRLLQASLRESEAARVEAQAAAADYQAVVDAMKAAHAAEREARVFGLAQRRLEDERERTAAELAAVRAAHDAAVAAAAVARDDNAVLRAQLQDLAARVRGYEVESCAPCVVLEDASRGRIVADEAEARGRLLASMLARVGAIAAAATVAGPSPTPGTSADADAAPMSHVGSPPADPTQIDAYQGAPHRPEGHGHGQAAAEYARLSSGQQRQRVPSLSERIAAFNGQPDQLVGQRGVPVSRANRMNDGRATELEAEVGKLQREVARLQRLLDAETAATEVMSERLASQEERSGGDTGGASGGAAWDMAESMAEWEAQHKAALRDALATQRAEHLAELARVEAVHAASRLSPSPS